MNEVKMIPVKSSAMLAVGYDESLQNLRIQFQKGNFYTYFSVPRNVFDSLMAAPSKGTYHAKFIQNKFPGRPG